jgi:hypothetical protein
VKQEDLPIRCTCSARPILAIARATDDGKWFIHVRVFKQRVVYGEMIVDSGSVRIKCRACSRWYKLTIRMSEVRHELENLPKGIEIPAN